MKELSVVEFVNNVFKAVNNACREIGITEGAIGVCIEPKIHPIAEWVGTPMYAATVTYMSPIDMDTENTLCFGEDGKVVSDTSGVINMKIASARQVLRYYEKEDIEVTSRSLLTSGSIPDELVGIGMTKWKGCVAFPIDIIVNGPVVNLRAATALNIFVAVSGGKQEQDEQAAWAALGPIRNWLSQKPDYDLHRCFYEKD